MYYWSPEAILTYARASMEARLKTENASATVVAPDPAARSGHGFDPRRLVETIRSYLPGVPAPKAYDTY